MNIYEILKEEHVKVLGLVDELIAAEKSDPTKRERLVEQIRNELIPHARAEEAILYNSMRDIAATKDVVGHAYREHMEAEAVLRSLQVSDKLNLSWVSGAKKLKEALSHHIDEEEGEVFGAAKKVFTEEEATVMGDVFKRMKPMIKEQSFFGQSVDMIVNMMPTRLRDAFSKVATLPVSEAS